MQYFRPIAEVVVIVALAMAFATAVGNEFTLVLAGTLLISPLWIGFVAVRYKHLAANERQR